MDAKHVSPARAILLLGSVLLILTGCVHRVPYEQEYYFQAMGDPAEVVVTVDMQSSQRLFGEQLVRDASFAELLDRVDRLSIALYNPDPAADADGLLDAEQLSSYSFYGGVEGNIPAFLTNTSLLWNPDWQQVENERTRYYRNEWLGLDVYAPRNGLLLFANGNYMKAYETTYRERTTKIPAGLADRMANSLFGFYIASPQAMIDVGLSIPRTVLLETRSMMLVVEDDGNGGLALGGVITMNTEKLANSLSILLKSSYISEKRRNKEPLGDLTNLIVLRDDAVVIDGMDLSDEQYAAFSEMFGSLASITGGENR